MSDLSKLTQDIEDIKNALNSLARNVVRIERVLAHEKYIPARLRTIEYSHKKRQLMFDKQYVMQFEKNEADLMGLLFIVKGKRTGLPKTGEIALSKIADDNKLLNLKPNSKKAVYSALKRINDRILYETRIDFFILTFNSVRFNDFAKRNVEV